MVKIGVLALQGDVEEHLRMLRLCGVEAMRVRTPAEVAGVDGLIIPGGESTTVGKLMERFGVDVMVKERAAAGMPLFGTCTGMIVLSSEIVGSQQQRLGLIDLKITRNAFGRQVDSFERDLDIPEVGPEPVRAVFIRAPWIEEAGRDVEVMAELDGKGVMARQGCVLVTAFHPELTGDQRVHQYFIRMVEEAVAAREGAGSKVVTPSG
ncbi:MAG: pyridoxal 5'-phosphate synthase glutaminase subunit PdxT, partial [Armatimonadota bacterium]|nr:pyridoxal 5'-phosphate synthase glutaminase subunit PdxT [Armatimonadota bacterium]